MADTDTVNRVVFGDFDWGGDCGRNCWIGLPYNPQESNIMEDVDNCRNPDGTPYRGVRGTQAAKSGKQPE